MTEENMKTLLDNAARTITGLRSELAAAEARVKWLELELETESARRASGIESARYQLWCDVYVAGVHVARAGADSLALAASEAVFRFNKRFTSPIQTEKEKTEV